MTGDYYDERRNTIETPFRSINDWINIMVQEGLIVLEVDDQSGQLEYIEPILVPGFDPAILRMALSFITEPGHDINQLDQQTVTQFLNIYSYLRVSQSIIDALIERSVSFAIEDPAQCPFGERLPNHVHVMFEDSHFIKIARQRVAQMFANNFPTNPSSPWTEEHDGSVDSTASSFDHASRILDAQMYEQMSEALTLYGPAHILAHSLDRRLLATIVGGEVVHIWNMQTYKEIGHYDFVSSVAFSPDGRYLATGSADCTARIWDVETHNQIGVPLRHNGSVLSVAFLPNGKLLAKEARGSIHVWGQKWDWPNWPFDYNGDFDYNGNLLKQLLMLKILRGLPLNHADMEIYAQLPEYAKRWVENRG